MASNGLRNALPPDEALRKAMKSAGVTAADMKPIQQPSMRIPSAGRSLVSIPGRFYRRLCIKIFLIGALVWDYTDTVLDLAAQMRVGHGTQRLSRTIREIRQDYDYMFRKRLDNEHMERICDLSLLFERINRDNLRKLNYGLLNEIHSRNSGLDKDYVYLLDAVLTALTVLDALLLYAAECDRMIVQAFPKAPHSCLPDHFRRLALLLPQYAGDHYFADSESRRITAKILLKEINNIELYDDNGKV